MRTNHPAARPGVSPFLLALAVCGCGADAGPSAGAAARALGVRPDLQVERAGLLAADRAYAAAAAATNVIEGVSAPMADDVYLLAGARPLAHGRDAARATLAANPLNATASQTWRPARVDVSGDGSRGYTDGYLTITFPPADGAPAQVVPGKYISFWKKVGGAWKVAAHVRDGRPAGDVTEAPPPGFETPTYRHYPRFPEIGAPAGVAVLKGVDPCPPGGTALRYQPFGAAFMADHCQRCHGADAPDRAGAPGAFLFDTAEQVRRRRARIYVRSAAGNDSMPPGPDDPSRAERDLLADWLACGAP